MPLNELETKYARSAVSGRVRGYEGVPFTKVFASSAGVPSDYTIVNADDASNVVAQKVSNHQSARPSWVDLIGSPDRLLATFPEGVEGQWLTEKPDGTLKSWKFNRKVLANTVPRLESTDDGLNWATSSITADLILNLVSQSPAATTILMYTYKTAAHFTEDAINSEVLELGVVCASNHNMVTYLASSLIGKVCTGSAKKARAYTSLNSKMIIENTGKLYSDQYYNIEHDALDLYPVDSPSVKALDYISHNYRGVLTLNYAYKELRSDATSFSLLGDDCKFQITDNQNTMKNLNNVDVLYGTASFKLPFFK